MTDIFISYSRKDKAMVSKLATALEAQGYVVWWDVSGLHGGQRFAREIHKQINQAKCAIVVWSQASVESEWVYSEASQAASRGILLTTVYQDAAVPLPYNTRHNEDLRGWNGKTNTEQFQKLLSAVEKYCPIPSAKTTPDDATVDEQPAQPAKPKLRKINYLAVALGILGVGAGGFLMQKSDDPAFWSGLVGEEKSQFELPKTEVPKQVEQPEVVAAVVSEKPKPKTYTLEVSTRPQNAIVTIDGKPYDPTAKRLPGRYAITVTADGYKPLENHAAFIHDRDVQTTLTLKPLRLPFEPEMVRIPAGTFTMGCVEGRDDVLEGGCADDEKPAHKVTISKDFSIGKYEVTFDEWNACTYDGACPKADDQGWGRGKRPVINVSWNDTQKYIGWLNKKTDKNYRLPTEAEWEYAARANAKTAFPWGGSISCSDANYGQYSRGCNDKEKRTDEVGSYSANAFGLYDTVGNVWEWTKDWKDTYDSSPVRDPQGAQSGSLRVLRGGSWIARGRYCRSANRNASGPSLRNRDIGFRLARGH